MSTACKQCNGIGYRMTASGEVARAEVCVCKRECDRCHGARYLLKIEGGYEVAAPCDCVSLHERVRLFNEAGVPAGYADKSTSNFVLRREEKPLAAAKTRFMQLERGIEIGKTRGVVLAGPPGVGKTHLVCALINYMTLQRGLACRFVDFFTLTARIRETYGQREDGATEGSLIEPLVDVPVLAIDDLGKGRGSNWELTIIDQLITRRYNAGRIVVATTNYLPEERPQPGRPDEPFGARFDGRPRKHQREPLEERIGDRLYSRLVEMADIVVVSGEDYRQRPPEKVAPGRGAPRTRPR